MHCLRYRFKARHPAHVLRPVTSMKQSEEEEQGLLTRFELQALHARIALSYTMITSIPSQHLHPSQNRFVHLHPQL